MKMTTGTKSVFYGAHCFFIHPWFVLWAYWRLFGFTLDPRIVVACLVHDIGYIGKHYMDDDEGQTHPILGARIMSWLFDWGGDKRWYNFTLLHSRWYAKRLKLPFSDLCVADKYAIVITPGWLYDILVRGTGEIEQYMGNAEAIEVKPIKPVVDLDFSQYLKITGLNRMKHGALTGDSRLWYDGLQIYMMQWVLEKEDILNGSVINLVDSRVVINRLSSRVVRKLMHLVSKYEYELAIERKRGHIDIKKYKI